MTDFAAARHNMVESQIRPNRVSNPALIEALQNVPREQFLPVASRPVAYVDEDIVVKRGRFLMEPRIMARLIETADIGLGDMVLDVGCGTGYSTAVLARLCGTAVGLESDDELAAEAEERLTALGIDNALIVRNDLREGYPDQAPYDVIIFGGAVAEIPDALREQLAERGRLLAIVRGDGIVGKATLMTKHGGVLSGREVFDAATPYLPGFEPAEDFRF
jgi:protein-L-isoaspartate(D-aspartate) O-methyltransferase